MRTRLPILPLLALGLWAAASRPAAAQTLSSADYRITSQATESAGSPTTSGSSTISSADYRIIFNQGRPSDDAKNASAVRLGEGYIQTLFPFSTLYISTGALPTGFTQRGYSATLAASGGTAPYAWSIVSGALPFGYTLGPATGTINGFAEVAQTATFTVLVTDSSASPLVAVKSFSILVLDNPGELANPGLNYPYFLSAHGFVADGWREFTWPGYDDPNFHRNIVTKLEGNSAQSLWKGSAPWRGGLLQQVATVPGKPFTVSFSAIMESNESGDYNVEIGIGLADGLTENPNDMTVTDLKWDSQVDLRNWNTFQATITPAQNHVTVFLIAWNKWAFATRATFDSGSGTQGILRIATTSLPPAVVNASYSQTLQAFNGTSPYTWSLFSGVLPTGLSLSSAGAIGGTPTAVETQTFVVRAVDSAGTPQEASQRLTLSTGIPPGIVTQPANATVTAGNVAMFSVTASGTEPLSYQWQKDRVDISGAGASSYTFNPSTSDDGTKYRVRVSNFVGSVMSAEATLTVTNAPPETPFPGAAFAVPGTIQAEDFDNGGEGVAYHDTEPQNLGGTYRAGEGVDIQGTGDVGGGFAVGWIHAGEWLQYTVNVAESGSYTLEARVASAGAGGTFHIEVGGVGGATGPDNSFTIPDTGGWETWQSIFKKGVGLQAGQQVLRIAFDTDSPVTGLVGKLDFIRITSENRLATPFSPGMVEIHLPYDVAGLTVTPTGGSPIAMTGITPRHAFAFIPLSSVGGASSPDPTGYTIADANSNAVLTSTLTWTPTNLTGSSSGGNVIAMRQGDSLLLTATGSGTTLQLDGDGDGIYEHTGAPGDRFAQAYNSTGTFIATAKIDGNIVGSATVKVIAVDLGGPIACEVGFQRTKNVAITPATEVGNVLIEADNFTPMEVSVQQGTATGVILNIGPLTRGTPVILARVGGPSGPIVAHQEVDEFTVDLPARTGVFIDPDTRIGSTVLDIHPYVGGLNIVFDMFASQSAFTGGVKSFTANTDTDMQLVLDQESGEVIGRLIYEIEVPPFEDKYCFTAQVFQQDANAPSGKASMLPGGTYRYAPPSPGTPASKGDHPNAPVIPECRITLEWVEVERNDGAHSLNPITTLSSYTAKFGRDPHPDSSGNMGERLFPDRTNPPNSPKDDKHNCVKVKATLVDKDGKPTTDLAHKHTIFFKLHDVDHYSSAPKDLTKDVEFDFNDTPQHPNAPGDNVAADRNLSNAVAFDTGNTTGFARLVDPANFKPGVPCENAKDKSSCDILPGSSSCEIGVVVTQPQPGNNWRVSAECDNSERLKQHNLKISDGTTVVLTSKNAKGETVEVPGPPPPQTTTLTIWRFAYTEEDNMTDIDLHQGSSPSVILNGTATFRNRVPDTGEAVIELVGTAIFAPGGTGQFDKGRITLTPIDANGQFIGQPPRTFTVTDNDTVAPNSSVTVNDPQQTLTFPRYRFDDLEDDDVDPTGLPRLGTRTRIPHSLALNDLTMYLPVACVEINSLRLASLNTTPAAPFKLHLGTDSGTPLGFTENETQDIANQIQAGKNATATDQYFWVLYFQGAFEGRVDIDLDPDSEVTPRAGAALRINNDAQNGVVIYYEVIRDSLTQHGSIDPTQVAEEKILHEADVTIVHEGGHLFQLEHKEGGIMSISPPPDQGPQPYTGTSLRKITRTLQPGITP